MSLDPRKQTILHAVVVEYVMTAEPVGSELLTHKYQLGVKSATVRNELAEMAELGYLEQPHTSAGRIPSDLGYRYYVDKLLEPQKPGDDVKDKLKSQNGDALLGMLRDTTRTLSRLTQLLTVATVYRDNGVTIRTALISAIGPRQAMLVLALSNGHLENRLFEIQDGATLEDIATANQEAQKTLVGKTLRQVMRIKPSQTASAAANKLLAALWTQVRSASRELTKGILVAEGAEFMVGQPEFQRDLGSLTAFMNWFSQSDELYDALVAPGDGQQTVSIGKEHKNSQLHQFSILRNVFYVGNHEAGVIAVVGPTRMKYEVGVPLLDYTAQNLTGTLSRFFG